jgi:hypothetical protein
VRSFDVVAAFTHSTNQRGVMPDRAVKRIDDKDDKAARHSARRIAAFGG